MKTPKNYIQFLNEGICDEQMLSDVIYSYNKRAKNSRDNILKYNSSNSQYKVDWIIKEEEKKDNYYNKKAELIRLFNDKIKCVHKHTVNKRKRVYDYEKEYEDITDYCYCSRYYDYEKEEYVYFVDYYVNEDNYYLCTEIGNRFFHTPIDITKENYSQFTINELPADFYTFGESTNNLLSVQFCNKVYDKFIKNTSH